MGNVKHSAEPPPSRTVSRGNCTNNTSVSFAPPPSPSMRSSGTDRALWSERNHRFKVDGTSLDDLIERHIPARLKNMDAVRAWDKRRATGQPVSVADANLLSGSVEEEEAIRLAIIRYRPQSDREAKLKLTYLAAYLIATRGTLATGETRLVPPVESGQPKTPIC